MACNCGKRKEEFWLVTVPSEDGDQRVIERSLVAARIAVTGSGGRYEKIDAQTAAQLRQDGVPLVE